VHAAAYIKKQLGFMMQLSDAETFAEIDDIYEGVGFNTAFCPSIHVLEQSFLKYYSPAAIYEWVAGLFLPGSSLRDEYVSWGNKHFKSIFVDEAASQKYRKKKEELMQLQSALLRVNFKPGVSQDEICALKQKIIDIAGEAYEPSRYFTPVELIKAERKETLPSAFLHPGTGSPNAIGILMMLRQLAVLQFVV
jgi:hypothetical protein